MKENHVNARRVVVTYPHADCHIDRRENVRHGKIGFVIWAPQQIRTPLEAFAFEPHGVLIEMLPYVFRTRLDVKGASWFKLGELKHEAIVRCRPFWR